MQKANGIIRQVVAQCVLLTALTPFTGMVQADNAPAATSSDTASLAEDSQNAVAGSRDAGPANNSPKVIAPNVDLKQVAPLSEVLNPAEFQNESDPKGKIPSPRDPDDSAGGVKVTSQSPSPSLSGDSSAVVSEDTIDAEIQPQKIESGDFKEDKSQATPSTSKGTQKAGSEDTGVRPLTSDADEPNQGVELSPNAKNTSRESVSTSASDASSQQESEQPFVILGAEVAPGTATRLAWSPGVTITGLASPVPVLVINGKEPGPTLCMTGAIHGDELNGIEVIRRVMYDIDPAELRGRIVGVPIVNLQGFQRGSRYLVDRRDLNRFFPGDMDGSLASRIAYSLFNEVITRCDALIDIHTGSLRRTNLPQLRADMANPMVAKFTEHFDEMVVIHGAGNPGMLRSAAVEYGIPAVTLELGESLRLQEGQVESGVTSINILLDRMEMYSRYFNWGDPEPVYYKSLWLRAELGGILFSRVGLGDVVKKGETLGVVTDPITNEESAIKSPYEGRVIGMAVNQVVMPGFAAYHLGIEASEKDVAKAAQNEKATQDSIEDTGRIIE